MKDSEPLCINETVVYLGKRYRIIGADLVYARYDLGYPHGGLAFVGRRRGHLTKDLVCFCEDARLRAS
jgi:hypothetical protein